MYPSCDTSLVSRVVFLCLTFANKIGINVEKIDSGTIVCIRSNTACYSFIKPLNPLRHQNVFTTHHPPSILNTNIAVSNKISKSASGKVIMVRKFQACQSKKIGLPLVKIIFTGAFYFVSIWLPSCNGNKSGPDS